MIRIILSVVISLLLILPIHLSFGNPFLTAKPSDELVDYYTISVNGKTYDYTTDIDMDFLHDMKYIDDGKYNLELRSGSYEHGISDPIKFFVIKHSEKKWITYKIEKDMTQISIDPQYENRFDVPQTIKIRNPNYELEVIRELQKRIEILEERVKELESQ